MRLCTSFCVLILWLGLISLPAITYGRKAAGQNGVSSRGTPRKPSKTGITLPGKVLVIPAKKEKLVDHAIKGISSASEKALHLAESLAQTASRVNRNIKEYFSSDFEVLLLRMTSPSDDMTTALDIERFIATTQSFIHNDDVLSESNTYRVTLRKIWAKIAEADSRTSLKALYMLHTLQKHSKPADGMIYRKLYNKMMKEYSTKSKTKYFDMRHIGKLKSGSDADSHEKQLQNFHTAYASYISCRGKDFTSNLEELKSIDYGRKAKDICALLQKTTKLIDAALVCGAGLHEESEIVAHCLELTARDLADLWRLFGTKLHWLLREHEVGDIFEGWNEKAVLATLGGLKEFYKTRYDHVQALLGEVNGLVELYKEAELPTQLEPAKDLLDGFL